mmetsp:Transcript_147589/g.411087  ORF Transcript_147589/g.411087 Transcript_147589/m.411087 type:complete len:269 (+) Transcript_147589:63-869(+)
MVGAGSGDEETAPLTKQEEKVYDEDSDPELAKNGGKYTSKYAIGQVTFRCPLDGPVHFIVLVYGFLPFIVPAAFIIHWAIHRGTLGLYGFCVSIVATIMNELIFKPIVKDPRPVESANKFKDKDGQMKMKPGMPSGHVLNATTIMVWSFLEVVCRGPGFHENLVITLEWLLFIFVIMAPVPWARWKNKDHTLNQCLVAGALGIVAGVAAYVIRISFFHPAAKPWPMPMDILANQTNETMASSSMLTTTMANSTMLTTAMASTTLANST